MKVGDKYNTKHSGQLSVVEYKCAKSVVVKFHDTGSVRVATAQCIQLGNVKDYFAPRVFGVGYIGVGKHKSRIGSRATPAYKRWEGILDRCYSGRFNQYRGCSVCEEWHNFQNFAEWYYKNMPNDGKSYEIDKDIKVSGNKIYGPDMCSIVTKKENMKHMPKVLFKLLSPCGGIFEFTNAAEFARNNGLCRYAIYDLARGKQKAHRGWKLAD